MELVKDFGIVFIRIITIFPLMLWVTLFIMGRRSIGEMPVFDFLVVLSLGSVVGADIAEPKIEHIPTAFAILVIGLVQKLFSYWVIRYRRFGKLVTFEPIIIIYEGKLVHKNLKKSKYSVDNIFQLLRENQIFDPSTVKLAIIEGSGNLSILEEAKASTTSISYPVIREGVIEEHILSTFGLDEVWLYAQLEQQQLDLKNIFVATIDDKHQLHCTRYIEPEHQQLPPIVH